MAALTWRNVDAPDFRSSMDGLKLSTGLLSGAFGGLKDNLKEFDNTQSEMANRAIQAQIAGMKTSSDADNVGALLAAADPRRLSADTINMATGRKTQLLGQETAEQAYKWQGNRQARTTGQEGAGDAAALLMPAYDAARRSADPKALPTFMAQNPGFMSGMDMQGTQSIISAGNTSETGALNNRDTVQDMTFSAQDQGFKVEDRKIQSQAARALAIASQGFDPQSRIAAINGIKDLDPRARLIALQGVQSLGANDSAYVDAAGPSGASAGFAAAAGGSAPIGESQLVVGQTLKKGGLSDFVVAGALGNFEVEGGYTGAQGDGGTAGGIAQWRGPRRANFTKIIGKDPTKATPAEQAEFFLWEMANPSQAGMTTQQVAEIKAAKSPQEAARLIDKYYERSDGKHRGRREEAAVRFMPSALGGSIANQASRTSLVANNPNAIAAKFPEAAANSKMDVGQAAAKLKGAYPGMDNAWLVTQINMVTTRLRDAGLPSNAAMAVAVLEDTQGEVGFFDSMNIASKDWWMERRNLGNLTLDNNKLDKLLESFSEGKFNDTVVANDTIGRNAGNRAVAQSRYDAAMTRYRRAEAAAKMGNNTDLSGPRNDVIEAGNMLGEFQAMGRPAPQPKTPSSVSGSPRPSTGRISNYQPVRGG